ncbi:uncharacterized protein LOC131994299 [Stomoxys calcitrans]|uniref:uncharacterized protein LOC131994299 n=1 Tax=Stomoxys calcitrans TaxID=35570 RepID=UPI0027E2D709|nr:uncharacterized protein LOC131994299 [Stomoxys calcitrans]
MSYRSLDKDQRYQLIELVKARPVLYDKSHILYRSVKEKEYRWREIAKISNASVLACKKAWKTLRDQYQRYVKMPKSKQKKYKYIKELSFLGDFKRTQGKDYSDFSDTDYSDDFDLLTTTSRTERNFTNSKSDAELEDHTMSQFTDNEEELTDVKDDRKSLGNIAAQVLSTFNNMVNQRFELHEDENDMFLRMLAKKMKCLPDIVKNRLQEGFLEQVNFETLQREQKL